MNSATAWHMDFPQSLINAVIRHHSEPENSSALRVNAEDIVVHKTKNSPKCAYLRNYGYER